MKQSTLIWTILCISGALFLTVRYLKTGMGDQFVRETTVERVRAINPEAAKDPKAEKFVWVDPNSEKANDFDLSAPGLERKKWVESAGVTYRSYMESQKDPKLKGSIVFSPARTIGIWLAALLTLAVLSFLYADNPFYKLAEAIFIGSSAAYQMVIAFWTVIVPNLMAKLVPGVAHSWSMPGLEADTAREWWFMVPLVLSILLLWRLMPKGGWISRWPLAFFIGATAGIRLIAYMKSDFAYQIKETIIPLVVLRRYANLEWLPSFGNHPLVVLIPHTYFDLWASVGNITIVIGVLSCLVYFFFSFEHKGITGKTARLGIWFLMITFGAGFGYTVMARIALLAARFQFLVDDWLWLIDPLHKRFLG